MLEKLVAQINRNAQGEIVDVILFLAKDVTDAGLVHRKGLTRVDRVVVWLFGQLHAAKSRPTRIVSKHLDVLLEAAQSRGRSLTGPAGVENHEQATPSLHRGNAGIILMPTIGMTSIIHQAQARPTNQFHVRKLTGGCRDLGIGPARL